MNGSRKRLMPGLPTTKVIMPPEGHGDALDWIAGIYLPRAQLASGSHHGLNTDEIVKRFVLRPT